MFVKNSRISGKAKSLELDTCDTGGEFRDAAGNVLLQVGTKLLRDKVSHDPLYRVLCH
jgi:hypothetical protein